MAHLFFYFIWMDVLPESTSLYNLSAWCPHRPEEGSGSPGTGFTDGYEQPYVCWLSNLDPL